MLTLNKKNKVVVNLSYGGFGLSNKAKELFCTSQGIPLSDFDPDEIPRHHPTLIEVVEKLGPQANGSSADLEIQLVGNEYHIATSDGAEWVIQPSDMIRIPDQC